ncbi:MAG: beta-1,6-N-acetylglucosaminyltransferase [Leadbetterella sp.]|nr:beta-1,6-N-acetylglucosaminyltransferase [Leadbetterella sp.]
MKVAHLIITYTDPLQTERMVKRMLDPDFDFYIHVDAKMPLNSHELLAKLPNVYFIKNRIDVKWAGFSTIQAELNSIHEILDSKRSYDFVSLLSGQDYPIRTVNEMKQFYEERKGKLMLKYREFEHEWVEGMERVSRYYLANYSFLGRYFVERLMNQLLPKRKLPKGLKFYGSSMFWCLSTDVLKYVLENVEQNNQRKRFYKFTWAPDEFLFQTEILNSPFADKVINENCHYYKHPPHTPNPQWLGVNDINDIMQSDRIFARKFNTNRDPEILNQLDILIDQRVQNS